MNLGREEHLSSDGEHDPDDDAVSHAGNNVTDTPLADLQGSLGESTTALRQLRRLSKVG
jgi:hypothetical protein